MARYIGPVCRLCRREDAKLFLKGDRCFSDKCGYERGSTRRVSTVRVARSAPATTVQQLREKQKVKRIYGHPREAVPRLLLQGLAHAWRDG